MKCGFGAQLAKATECGCGPGFESGIPHSLLNGAMNYDCVSKTNLKMGGVPAYAKKLIIYIN
jgi:hypothetical protein